jgi:hypothetical protein
LEVPVLSCTHPCWWADKEVARMRRRLIWMTVLAVVAALAIPMGALADDGSGDDNAGEVEFHGVIESLPDPGPVGDWMVSGRTVHVTDATELEGSDQGDCDENEGDDNSGDEGNDNSGDDQGENEGDDNSGDDQGENDGDDDSGGNDGDDQGENEDCDQSATFAVGDDVEVKGTAEADGSITATKVEADDEGENEDEADDDDGAVIMLGTAQRIARTATHVGFWKVSSHQVRVLKTTKIVRNGRTLHRGAHLRVTGKWFAGGTIRATRIAIVR